MVVYEKDEAQQENPQKPEEQQIAEKPPQRAARPVGVIPLQAMLCAAVLALLLLLRALLPGLYGAVKEIYDREMARSVLITEDDI